MINAHTYHNLFEQLDSETTVITPNRRLSATLHKLYQQHQLNQKKTCWQTPDILPVTTWIQRLWDDYTQKEFDDTPLILNSAQEHYLWENIITASQDNSPLLQVSETAEIAKSAWGLLKQWLVTTISQEENNEDYVALQTWSNSFKRLCQDNDWVDSATLTDMVIEKIKPQKKIKLIGFNELSPQLSKLVAKTQSEHIHIMTDSQQHLIAIKDTEQEILTMARFAKSIAAKDKNARIGCVIPSLDKIRDRVKQVFTDVFCDEQFNLSAGKPLLQCPIIYTALQLLGLHKQSILLDQFSSILTSPFLGSAEFERIRRANFDSQLRRDNVTTVHFPLEALGKNCSQLAKRLQVFFTLLTETDKTQSFHRWAKTFTDLLAALGWPGERSLSSEEYQMVEHWLRLLDEFSTLDRVSEPATISRALHTIQKMAVKSIFQPKTPDSRVHVLGILEAAGLPFDYLWVAGMDDMSWPPQPKPNPLIPKRIQRELNMPHATAEREFIYCQQITQQFKQSAKQVIFSHTEKLDELELQASPLLRDLPVMSIEQLQLDDYQSSAEKIYSLRMTENLQDDVAPALQDGCKIRGGVNVLKQQALCPFKAFSEWRLHARELESPLPGLRAKDRGSILHKAMELFWNQLQDHANLIAEDENSLKKITDTCIDKALLAIPNAHTHHQKYLTLEKQRLHKLILDWLEIEKRRPPFKVLTSEKSVDINLNHLHFTVRIDRIDEVNGKKLIIDYKTGKNNDVNSWLGERPDEPQLPLYALLDTENTIGITFAQIVPGKNCFKGISAGSIDIKGINTSPSWQEQLSAWNQTLTSLSDDFYSGIAKVDPKDPVETCQWCSLKSLCRISEEI
jgi:probable DNA repair protein